MKYDIKENNPYWLNKGPWYNTEVWSKLQVTVFENYIRNNRTYRYNLMCCITEHDRLVSTYVDDSISVRDRAIPKNATTVELE